MGFEVAFSELINSNLCPQTYNLEPRSLLPHQRLGLYLHKHLGVDEALDLDHRRRWANVAKYVTVSAADGFPIARDVDDINARANDVAERGAGALESSRDIGQCLSSLRGRIASANEAAVSSRCRSTGHVDVVVDANGTGVADDRLPGCPGSEILSHDAC